MNRIRKYKNKIQVLITPHHKFDSGFELMLGNWTDIHLKNYNVLNFNTMEDAINEALRYPDINWDQMILWHKNNFNKITEIIQYELRINNFNVEFKHRLLNSYQIKNIMFDRIMALGERFRLGYHLNDIISYHITNLFSDDIRALTEILSENQALRIIYKTNDNGIIKLVGKTDIGTTYEIVLWTTFTMVDVRCKKSTSSFK